MSSSISDTAAESSTNFEDSAAIEEPLVLIARGDARPSGTHWLLQEINPLANVCVAWRLHLQVVDLQFTYEYDRI
jgi:hypothetical protein